MILISKKEVSILRKAGLDEYIFIANRSHGSKCKTYYAVEHPKVFALINKE